MLSLFFSYSHRDEDARNELEVHLAMLRRQGIIDTWHDRRIGAGKDVDRAISEQLASADIILLLVSPHFLASDYCYEAEMERALARHHAGEARVIPVILQPCDWQSAPFGRLRVTPPDGRPVAKYPNVNDAYLAVVQDIRIAVNELRVSKSVSLPESTRVPPSSRKEPLVVQERSSNLRIKREVTDVERDDFLGEAFEYVARFFENSLGELQLRNPGTEGRYRRIDASHFEAAVYVHGKSRVQCRIWHSTRRGFMPGLGYSTTPSPSDSSFNELLSVVDDGLTLGLWPQLHGSHALPSGNQMTLEGAAEYLWGLFIEQLQ
jgi:hypothetical protein